MTRLAQATRLSEAEAKAPGKVILAGEHFVVLGAPAIAMAINLYSRVKVKPRVTPGVDVGFDLPLKLLTKQDRSRVPDSNSLLQPLQIAARATLDLVGRKRSGVSVNVECQIPVGAGLGSSASTTVAIVSAVAKSQGVRLTRKQVFQLAFVAERFLHGKPSGVDQATCIYGGTIQFTRPSYVKPIPIQASPVLLLCDTGIHHATRTLVGSVVDRSRKEKVIFQDHLDHVREISRKMVKALKTGDDEQLGHLMSQNHELLMRIGVSHPMLDRLVAAATKAGALGAKLTGAGGGGCIIAVCEGTKNRQTIAKRLRREGGTPMNISLDTHGLEVATA